MTVFLRMLYLRTEQDLLKELNRLRENGFVEYGTYASLMRVQAILQEMQDESFQYVPQAINKVFNETNKRLGYKAAEALSVPQTAIAEQLAANLLGNINEAAETAFRTSERIMQIGRLHPDAFRNPTIEASLFREAGGVGQTAVEKALKTFNTQNVTSFVDKSGREWGLTEYCTMATRTVSKQAVVAAELTADDWDLWKISPNGTTCALCAAYEGRVYSKSGTNPDYPPLSAAFGKIDAAGGDDLSNTYLNIHPNCLVPGGSVLGEGIVAESRRLYSGEIIILKTSRGNEIAVTPNHPILTDRGFIAAYLLKEGDKVIEATGEYGRLIGKAPNNIDVPTVVNEKLHSLMQSCGGSSHTVKGTAEQFHGDGIPDSKVDIVFANGFRRSELNTPGNKEIPEKKFPSGILRRYKFLSDCPAAKVFLGAFHALNGIVSGGGFVRRIKGITEHGEHLSDLSKGTSALGGDLVISKPLVMQGKKALEHLTMFINVFFRNIRELLTPGSWGNGNTEVGFGNLNHIRADRKFPRNISTGEPLLIARIEELLRNDGLVIGELTHVESSFYDGYVYNFETEYGYYVYNNIVTHNCLHSLVKYTTAGRTEKEIQRDKDFSSFEKRPANVDYRTKRQVKEYREKEKARAEFLETRRQWNEYRERLGDKIPSLETFEKHKKAGDDKYKEWMSAYRKKGAEIRKSLPKPEPIPVEPVIPPTPKPPVKQISSPAEVKDALLADVGFSDMSSDVMGLNKTLMVDTTNQLLSLEDKFGVIHSGRCSIVAINDGGATAAVFPGGGVTINNQDLTLCPSWYKNRKKLVETFETRSRLDRQGRPGYFMPMEQGKAAIYPVTHEYGHMVQFRLMQERLTQKGIIIDRASFRAMSPKQREEQLKRIETGKKDVARDCREEILGIAKSRNPNFQVDMNISSYGQSDDYEFFAECFANSQLGAPNELGEAMAIWLERNGQLR